MKKLSAYLFLILFSFSAPSFADDIQDFEIEGMTIGDSLLDYMSEEEIKENEFPGVYPDKKFTLSDYNKSSAIYDSVSIEYKPNDKKYIIYGVQGVVDFSNNTEGCYKKQDEIEKEISSMFNEAKKKNWGILKLHLKGTAAEGSTYKPITFSFNTGDRISISCYHYSDTPQADHLKISLTSKEFMEYIKEEAVQSNN